MGSFEEFVGLLDHVSDVVAVVDADGQVRTVNDATERLLGYDATALVGTSAFEHVHPDDETAVESAFGRVVGADEPTTESVTHRYRDSEGRWLWLESQISNPGGDVVDGYVVTSRDVSRELASTLPDYETSAAKLLALTRTVSDVLWMFDGTWDELLFVNDAIEDIYGVSVEQLRRDPTAFLDVIHPDDRRTVEDAMARLSGGESVDIEYRVDPAQDYATWVWVRGTPIVEGGAVTRIVGFSRDITDRRQRERQLAVMENLLRHNLRNDMTTILGNAELIADRSDETETRAETIVRVAESLLDSADKQRQIIGLLTSNCVPRRFDLARIVEGEVEALRDSFPAATITTSLPPSAAVTALEEISLAVIELIENAIRYAETDQPTVEVGVEVDGESVVLTIADECPPIPESEFRVLSGDREMDEIYHTTGLGLWLTHWVVELSDGRIEFDRAETTGNTVRVVLPRAEGL